MMECFSDQKREGLLGDSETMKITYPPVSADTRCKLAGPFHGKSSQVEKNKLSNYAMKTGIYYFCIAYLICSKTIFRIQ